MGLFDKFKKRFSKSGDVEEPVENNDSSEDQLYMEKYQTNNQNIADEVMDILMSVSYTHLTLPTIYSV